MPHTVPVIEEERATVERLMRLCEHRAVVAGVLLDDAGRQRYEHAAQALAEILAEDELPT
jgi:NADPH-dependent curcumin reductase CurA